MYSVLVTGLHQYTHVVANLCSVVFSWNHHIHEMFSTLYTFTQTILWTFPEAYTCSVHVSCPGTNLQW